ncbi:unnamed protein product [Cochlearia groenlandica]
MKLSKPKDLLITDLPDDLTRECLSRVSYTHFHLVSSVCKAWKRQITDPDFLRHRKTLGRSQELVFLSKIWGDPVRKNEPGMSLHNQICVLELKSGLWNELPPIPRRLHPFCKLASVGSDLVVMDGVNVWCMSDSVLVFNMLTYTWRVGKKMPCGSRRFLTCASDSERNVFALVENDYVGENVMMSALMYDVAEDKWIGLPDVCRERETLALIFHAGRFQVVSSYPLYKPDPTWNENVDPRSLRMPAFAIDENRDHYVCDCRVLMMLRDDTWREIADLPDDVGDISYMAISRNMRKVVVIGSSRYDKPDIGYSWDINNSRWAKIEMDNKIQGYVRVGCFMEI